MVTFQRNTETKMERQSYSIRKDFHLALERKESYTPPTDKPDLHSTRRWIARRYEGGTIEDALPILEIGLMEGSTVYWKGRQYTEADIKLHKGLARLDDNLNQLKTGSLEKLPVQERELIRR